MNEFRIVKIIDEYRVVVNCGSKQNIAEGNTLEVYERGETVIDPFTKQNLGTLDYIKAKLRVADVYPNMCICENRDDNFGKNLQELFSWTSSEKTPLNVDTLSISGGFENVSKKIKIGDYVRKTN